MNNQVIEAAANEIKNLVITKNEEYGDAYPKIAACLKALYPGSIPESDYVILPKLLRNIEKLARYSAGAKDPDIGMDICGIWLNQVVEDIERGKIIIK
jgi:hypothetical protein